MWQRLILTKYEELLQKNSGKKVMKHKKSTFPHRQQLCSQNLSNATI